MKKIEGKKNKIKIIMESAGSSKRVHFAECSQAGMYTVLVYSIRSYNKRSYITYKSEKLARFFLFR